MKILKQGKYTHEIRCIHRDNMLFGNGKETTLHVRTIIKIRKCRYGSLCVGTYKKFNERKKVLKLMFDYNKKYLSKHYGKNN